MKIVLSNLPQGVEQGEVEELVEKYTSVKSAEFMEEAESDDADSKQGDWMVTLEDENRVAADVVVHKLNGLHWKGVQISARVILFQSDTDPGTK